MAGSASSQLIKVTFSIDIKLEPSPKWIRLPGPVVVQVFSDAHVIDVMYEAANSNPDYRFQWQVFTKWGKFITAISNITADLSQKIYWDFLCNGEPLSKGVSLASVQDGDKICAQLTMATGPGQKERMSSVVDVHPSCIYHVDHPVAKACASSEHQ